MSDSLGPWDILGHPGTLGIHLRRINERGARSGASRPGESTRKPPVVSPADRGRMAPESGLRTFEKLDVSPVPKHSKALLSFLLC